MIMVSDKSRNIGLRIREERIKRGITQSALGYAMGYTGGKLLRIERGYAQVTDELMASAARALGVATEVLLSPPIYSRASYITVKTVKHMGRPRKGR